jgi:hypothetical protein
MIGRAMPSVAAAASLDPAVSPRMRAKRTPHPNQLAALRLTQWKPGQVVNPGGRTDDYIKCQRICREASPDAARKLVELINDPDPRIALMAADKIVDRAWGRPRDYDPKRDAEHPRPTFDPRAYSTAELLQLEVALKLLMENRTVVEDAPTASK